MALFEDIYNILINNNIFGYLWNTGTNLASLQPGGSFEAFPVSEGFILDLLANNGAEGLTGGTLSDRIYFKYTFNQFEETKSANYAEVNIMGRSEPMLGYAGSGPRIFTLPLVFAATEQNFHFSQVIAPIWLIRSWLYPDYNTTQQPKTPPPLLLVMGSWLSQRVVARSATIRYHGPWGRTHLTTNLYNDLMGVSDLTADQIKESLFRGSSQLEMLPAGAKFIGTRSPFKDSMLPMWVEVTLVLQETMDNTVYTPFDTRNVRKGEDTGSGLFYS